MIEATDSFYWEKLLPRMRRIQQVLLEAEKSLKEEIPDIVTGPARSVEFVRRAMFLCSQMTIISSDGAPRYQHGRMCDSDRSHSSSEQYFEKNTRFTNGGFHSGKEQENMVGKFAEHIFIRELLAQFGTQYKSNGRVEWFIYPSDNRSRQAIDPQILMGLYIAAAFLKQ
jgi:hypothetical protein